MVTVFNNHFFGQIVLDACLVVSAKVVFGNTANLSSKWLQTSCLPREPNAANQLAWCSIFKINMGLHNRANWPRILRNRGLTPLLNSENTKITEYRAEG